MNTKSSPPLLASGDGLPEARLIKVKCKERFYVQVQVQRFSQEVSILFQFEGSVKWFLCVCYDAQK